MPRPIKSDHWSIRMGVGEIILNMEGSLEWGKGKNYLQNMRINLKQYIFNRFSIKFLYLSCRKTQIA